MKAKFFQLLEEMNKADPRFTVYAKALLFYYMPNQGELFITHNWYIANLLGIHEKTLLKAKKELVNRGVICVDPAYSGKKNNRISGTYVTVNYDWKTTNDRILNNVIQNNVIQNNAIQNNVIQNNGIQRGALIREKDLHREKDLNREKDPQGKDLTREKAEGAAAEPPPAPALSEGSQNEPERVPGEKPKKEWKQFIPPTKEEIRLELESLLERKDTIKQWSNSDLQLMTELFFEHYQATDWRKNNGQKLKDWRASLNTQWLLKREYLPDKTTRNQPGRARGQVTTAARIMELAGNTDPQRALEQRREQEIQKGGVIIQD